MPFPLCLPEFLPVAGQAFRLLVVVRTDSPADSEFAANWLARTGAIAGTRMSGGAGACHLLLLSEIMPDFDELLLPLEYLLMFWPMARAANSRPKIVDTRLVAPDFCLAELAPAPSAENPGDAGPAGRYKLRLDAGTEFGSGSHPSTRLSILAMEDLAGRVGVFPARLLDVGCGSGILSMIGIRLGAATALAVDSSPRAVEVARRNAYANGLGDMITVTDAALAELNGQADLAVANLAISVLFGLFPEIAGRVVPGGWLICSGFIGRQSREVRRLAVSHGFAVVEEFAEERWRALLLRNHSGFKSKVEREGK